LQPKTVSAWDDYISAKLESSWNPRFMAPDFINIGVPADKIERMRKGEAVVRPRRRQERRNHAARRH
jgi:hypothetical protein